MDDHANVPVLPPVIPLIGLAAAAVVHALAPLHWGAREICVPLGIGLLIASFAIVGLAIMELRRARTAFDVRRPTTRVVRNGIFKVSRNPTYLSLLMLCWALGFLADSLLVSLVAIPIGSVLCLVVIRREERYLLQKFGAGYADYCTAVRRWI